MIFLPVAVPLCPSPHCTLHCPQALWSPHITPWWVYSSCVCGRALPAPLRPAVECSLHDSRAGRNLSSAFRLLLVCVSSRFCATAQDEKSGEVWGTQLTSHAHHTRAPSSCTLFVLLFFLIFLQRGRGVGSPDADGSCVGNSDSDGWGARASCFVFHSVLAPSAGMGGDVVHHPPRARHTPGPLPRGC